MKNDEWYRISLWFSLDIYTELTFKSRRKLLGHFGPSVETERKKMKIKPHLWIIATHYTSFSLVKKNAEFCHDDDLSNGKWKSRHYFSRIIEQFCSLWNFIFSLKWTFSMELPLSDVEYIESSMSEEWWWGRWESIGMNMPAN